MEPNEIDQLYKTDPKAAMRARRDLMQETLDEFRPGQFKVMLRGRDFHIRPVRGSKTWNKIYRVNSIDAKEE
jgi:hypothetical protein